MFGAALFAPIARAASGKIPVIDTGPPSSAVFTAGQTALVTALSERVIPTTDTPGSITAEVPPFSEQLLADWGIAEEKAQNIPSPHAYEGQDQHRTQKPPP